MERVEWGHVYAWVGMAMPLPTGSDVDPWSRACGTCSCRSVAVVLAHGDGREVCLLDVPAGWRPGVPSARRARPLLRDNRTCPVGCVAGR